MSFLNEKGVTYNVEKGGEVPSDVKPGDTVNVSEGVMNRLEVMAMESSSLEEFLGDVYEEYPQHEGNSEIKEELIKFYLDLGGPIDEGKLSKAAGYVAIMAALLGLNKATSESIYNSDPKIKDAIENYEDAKEAGNKENMAKFKKEIKLRKLAWDINKPMDEAKTIESIKEIVKKCYNKGMAKENIAKVIKEYQKRLNKGQQSKMNEGQFALNGQEVIPDGTPDGELNFELNGREVVDLEADGQYINKAYYLDTHKELNDNELDDLINKYPADLEFGGEWWEQRR